MARQNTIELVIRATDQATSVLQGVANQLDGLNRSFAQAGGGLLAVSTPLAAGFGAAIKNATDFQEAMTNTNSLLQLSGEEFGALNDELLGYASGTRAGPQAVAEAYYEIVSGVADATTHMAILQAAVNTSEAGNAELAGTTAALIGVMNAYGFAAEDAAMVSDIFTRTVGVGVVSMDELAAALPNVTSLAASQGIALEEVAGALALITTTGTTAAEGSTQLRAAITSLINPNAKMIEAFEELGVASGEALIEQYGLVGALELIADTSAVAENGLAATVGSTEALNAALVLTTDSAGEFLLAFGEGIDGATAAAIDIQNASLAAEFDKLTSSVSVLSILIGAVFVPELTELAAATREIVQDLAGWVQANPEIVRTIGEAVLVVAALGTAFLSASAAISTAGLLIAGLTNPITAVITAGTLLTTAYTRNWLGFGDAVDTGVGKAKEALVDIGDFFAGFTLPDLSGLREGVGSAITSAIDGVSVAADSLPNLKTAAATGVASALNGIALVSDTLTGFNDTVGAAVGDALAGITFTMPDIGTGWAAQIGEIQMPSIDFSDLGMSVNKDVLHAIVSVAGIVFGGPIGMAIGAANLVVMAYEQDFMGFKGLVDQSGILGYVEEGLDSILTFTTDFLAGVGEGEGGIGGGENFITGFVDGITGAFGPLEDWLNDKWVVIDEGLTDLKDGVKGFFTAFEGTETSGFSNLIPVIETIGTALAGLLVVAADITVEGFSNTLTVIGEVLPVLGSAISGLITTASRLLEGDYAGALDSFLTTIVDFVTGMGGVQLTAITEAIDSITTLTGIDLTTVADNALGIGESIIDGVVQGITSTLSEVGLALIGPEDSVLSTIKNLMAFVATPFTGTGEGTLAGAIIGGAGSLLTAGVTLAESLINGLLDGLAGLAGAFVDAINSALPNDISFSVPSVKLWDPVEVEGETIIPGASIPGFNFRMDFPDNPIPGGSGGGGLFGGFRDSGGFGRAGVGYAIGMGAQPELFVPGMDGQFIPNIDQVMASMASRLQQADAMLARMDGSGGGTTVYVEIPLEVMRDEPNVVRNAGLFADMLEQRLNAI